MIPRKAYSRVLVVRTASENLVLEPQQFPLLETLLENIECWPEVLVAAGGLLIPMYTGSGDREARLTPLASGSAPSGVLLVVFFEGQWDGESAKQLPVDVVNETVQFGFLAHRFLVQMRQYPIRASSR